MDTHVYTTHGCCDPSASPSSAWSVAARFWCCGGSFHDYACACCMPCQLGVIKSKDGSPMNCGCPTDWCPTTTSGWTTCAISTCFTACCPLVYLFIASEIVDENNGSGSTPDENGCCPKLCNGTDWCSACTWLLLGPCACAHCAIAAYARNSMPTSEQLMK
jgi:hypothetical protein